MRMGRHIIKRQTQARDWLPVAAAVTEDANERIGGGIKKAAVAGALKEYRAARAERLGGGVGRERMDTAHTELRRAQIGADAEAGRLADLVVHIGPGATAGTGAPAFYREADREVVLDSAVALPGVDPDSVRWRDPLWRAEHLRAAGLVEHELGHAAHTPRRVLEEWHRAGGATESFARRLEETRMEASALRAGADRDALAGVAHELILRDFTGATGDPFTDALDAALILGRSELVGGSLPADDVKPFRDAYAERHGAGWVDQLDELLRDWNSTDDRDVPDGDGMTELRTRWADAIGHGDEAGDEAGGSSGDGEAGDTEAPESGGDGTPNDEQGDDSAGGSSGGEDDTDGDDSAGDSSAGDQDDDDDEGDSSAGGGDQAGDDDDDTDTEAGDDEAGDPIRDMLDEAAGEAGRRARAAADELREQQERDDQRMIDEVTHGYSPGYGRHHPQHTETIDAEARRFAVQLAGELRRLALPEVARSHRASMLPPGRLRGRGVVLGEAQRATGATVTAEPFRATRKTVTKTPPPVVGIMLDVSGSMSVAQRPAAVAAWALAEAGRSVQARTALATFGDRGRLVEHHPTQLTVTHCGGSWENFREGFAVLDRKLRLTTPAQGARLLIVVSDGALVGPDEGQAAARIMRRLESQGVVCLWVPIGCDWEGNYGEGWTNRAGHVVPIARGASFTEMARSITAGVESAMRRVRVSL